MKTLDRDSSWIAPSRYPEINYWSQKHWHELFQDDQFTDWKRAIEIFEDRIKYRYIEAIQKLRQTDDQLFYCELPRRFGFAILALECLLIETLAQFYDGLRDSNEAAKLFKQNNCDFYVSFLTKKSFKLKEYFTDDSALLFYHTIRCGILHQAETKASSLIRFNSKEHEPIKITQDQKGVLVFRPALSNLVIAEFHAYCNKLKSDNNDALRRNFVRKMNFICGLGI